jgi:hypothetical protein
MKKALQGEIGKSIVLKNFQETPHKHIMISWGRIHSYLKAYGLPFLRFCYMLVGIGGLVGVVIIILKVIFLSSISYWDMVMIFGFACISLGAVRVGFYSFYKLIEPPNI